MKKKQLVTKVVSMAATASMVATLFPTTAFAVTGDKVAKDGVYKSADHTATRDEVEDEEDDWSNYDVNVELTVSDGKIANIVVNKSTGYDSGNDSYFKKATSGKKGVYTKLIGQDATEDTINAYDTETGATRTATAVKEALLEAIHSASEAEEEAALDTTELEKAISAAEALTESDYTADSWSAMQTALTDAKSVLEAKESQEALDSAAKTLNAAIEALAEAEKEEECTYVYMNIPYDKFYENEVNNDVAVDAYTSATKSKPQNWNLSAGSYHEDETGSSINGAVYAVKVPAGVDLSKYTQITDDTSISITSTAKGQTSTTTLTGKDALFQSGDYSYYVIEGDAPTSYKELTVNEDGSFSFGKATGEAKTSTATASLSTSTGYGDYQLDLDISSTDLGYGEKETAQVNGVVITTTDGTSYGLRTMENIWRVSELAWCTGFTSNVHGSPTSSAHYASMMGKTIDSVTYYTPNGIYTFDIEDTYVPVKTNDASVSVDDTDISAKEAKIDMTLPEAYKASATITDSTGEFAGTVDLDSKKITWTKALPGTYTLNITDESGTYADISASFKLTTEEEVAEYNEEEVSLTAKDGVTDSEYKNFLKNITSVSVNGKSYSASGRNSVSIIDSATGDLKTDAKSGSTEIFAEDGDYTIVVTATGYSNPLTFTYTKGEEEADEYSYVYVGMTWAEYWANEDVYQAGNTASSDTQDSHSEYDTGAFDTVTRATTNHGMHRGSFQCMATLYDVNGNSYQISKWNSKEELVLVGGETATFTAADRSSGTPAMINGVAVDHYEVSGLKYVPVKVKTADLAALKDSYSVVENGETLEGGFGENSLASYSVTANVTENTYGLKEATKTTDGFSFGERSSEGTESGIKDQDLKVASGVETTVKEADGTYGEFLRVDITGDYGDLGANMQAVTWTYYGNDSTYTNALATYGTKFAADNWMHKSMGIQLGLTDSIRCQLPEGYDGTGYWTITVRALGYEDYTFSFQATEDNIVKASEEAADKTELQAAVDKAKALTESDYTADSWASMQTELGEAEDILAKEDASQAEVDEAKSHLNAAIEALEKVEEPEITIDTSALEAAIEKADALVEKEADYTTDSWTDFKWARDNAHEALIALESQEDVDKCAESLLSAIDALVLRSDVNTTSLEKAISDAKALKEADYTADSWKSLQSALESANAALEAKESQTAVDEAAKNLNTAISGLEKAKSSSNSTNGTSNKNGSTTNSTGTKNSTGTSASNTSANTGDTTNAAGWIALAGSSIAAMVAALAARLLRRKK